MNSTILITVFDTSPIFLFEALQSCFTQTLPPAEVLLVDNGSNDPSTVRFLTQVQSGFDQRLKVMFMGRPVGNSECLNMGILNAQNDLIVRMNASDIMLPHRLERQNYAFENASADLLGAQVMFFGEQFGEYTSHPSAIDRDMAFNHKDGWFLNHPAVMYHRNSVLELGGYDPAFDGCEDMELWYRMIANGRRLTNINDVLLLHRIHGQQATAKPRPVNLPLFKSYLQPTARAFG